MKTTEQSKHSTEPFLESDQGYGYLSEYLQS